MADADPGNLTSTSDGLESRTRGLPRQSTQMTVAASIPSQYQQLPTTVVPSAGPPLPPPIPAPAPSQLPPQAIQQQQPPMVAQMPYVVGVPQQQMSYFPQTGQTAAVYPPQQLQPMQMMPQQQGAAYYSQAPGMYYTGGANPAIMMYPDQTQQNAGCGCGCENNTKTSMKVMRVLQLAFSVTLLLSSCAMMALSPGFSTGSYYYYYQTWYYDMWTIVLPICTTISTMVQLSGTNLVNPGCAANNTPQCRSVSDLIFAILYVVWCGLLASVAWIFMYFPSYNIAGFIAFLCIANASSAIVCILYWITYSNIAGCCLCLTDL